MLLWIMNLDFAGTAGEAEAITVDEWRVGVMASMQRVSQMDEMNRVADMQVET